MAQKIDSQYDLANLLFPEKHSEAEIEILDVPLEQRRLVTDTLDYTVATIVSLIDDHEIVIPRFQRNYVWSLEQASRLIESLIIQCPIPNIFVSEEPDDKLLVIDGNQRILTLYNYKKDRFALNGLRTYSDLNGLKFSDLDPRFQRHINSRPLRFIKIAKETHPLIKFDVFERINSGAVRLTAQELRHGLNFGTLMETLDQLSLSKDWKAIASQGSDQRMRSAELLLRFWALRYELKGYKKPLEDFLNGFASRHRSIETSKLQAWTTEATEVARLVNYLFGKLAFRAIDKNGGITKLINSAIFDAEMVGVATAKNRAKLEKIKPMDFQKNLRQFLLTDAEFKSYVSAATSDLSSVQGRIRRFRTFLEMQ